MHVHVEHGDLTKVDADAIIVNLFKGVTTPGGATGAVDAATGGAITKRIASGDIKGRFGEVTTLFPDGVGAPRVLVVGLGKQEDLTLDHVRRLAARTARRTRDAGLKRVATVVHGAGVGGLDAAAAAQAMAEGVVLGTYRFDVYKSGREEDEDDEDGRKELDAVVLVELDEAKAAAMREAAGVGVTIAESANFAREVATLSGPEAHPASIAERVRTMAGDVGLTCEVLGREEVRDLGMGGLLGVNQGSEVEPRFVVLEHTPSGGADDAPTVVVIGKGITFDTGGISIKPSANMDEMRFDKSGAAATYGILRAASLLDLPVRVVGLTPLTDNMPGGNALKPGDVIKAMNGKTIEVLNTDAEGRLVLADALCYADRYAPDAVVDMATLTGAVVVGLGNQVSGLLGNDDRLVQRLKDAGARSHERVWELPLYKEYDKQIESKVADMKNIGGRQAGTITAAMFLHHFVGDWPWAHLDIAATAWNSGKPEFNGDYTPTAATGVGVRLVVDMLRTWERLGGLEKKW